MHVWNRLDRENRWLVVFAAGLWVLQFIYLLSPIDLLPDFIPLLGWADDLVALLTTVGVSAVTATRLARDPGVGELLPAALRPRHVATGAPVHLEDEAEPAGYQPLSQDEIRKL